jgi:hypothetical protein
MGLRIVARKVDEQQYDVDIRSASFGKHEAGETVSSKMMRARPTDCRCAIRHQRHGLPAAAHRQDAVTDVVAEQVNLGSSPAKAT